ncbi:MAG: adenylate/guanylate cyclase domain-containing protein, partial [Betaproteobacteria bacterium]
DVASMRRQLLLIGSEAAHALTDVLTAPQVIAFSGHMIDRADRATPRFPAALEPRVAAALRETIAELGPSIGYAQAACGGDILFLEALQDVGAQTQVVLPFAASHYVATSVSFAGADWTRRFERVLARATRVLVATDEAFLGDDVLFEHAANLIQGMAFLRARELSTHPLMLTVSERSPVAPPGGTVATARNWTGRGARIVNIDLAALRGDSPERDSIAASRGAGVSQETSRARSLQSLLFADISGFSRMPEQYAPDFAKMFLGTCKLILDALPDKPSVARTLGDGLFLAFDMPSHAAEFAIRLQQALGKVDWQALGLAAETGVRIGLHTGPIFRIHDPVTDMPTCYGTHVNRTARLEPIVLPRQIFVTEEFAASLVAENQDRFHCDYIGTMALAKHFGDARLYRLRWTMDE